jgi:hypothetical protein
MGDTCLHGAFDLDRCDLVRTGHRPGQALQRGQPQDRALPPAQRQVRRAHIAEARRPVDRRRGRLRRHRQGLRADARPLRGGRARRARDAPAQEDQDHRDRGLRRALGHRPDLLRPPLLPGAGDRRGQALPPARRGHARDRPRGHRAGGHPLQGGARRPAADGRPRAGDVDHALPRRDRRARRHRRDLGHGRRRGDQARARHRQAARRVAGRALRLVQVPRHLPPGRPRPDRAQGGRRGPPTTRRSPCRT